MHVAFNDRHWLLGSGFDKIMIIKGDRTIINSSLNLSTDAPLERSLLSPGLELNISFCFKSWIIAPNWNKVYLQSLNENYMEVFVYEIWSILYYPQTWMIYWNLASKYSAYILPLFKYLELPLQIHIIYCLEVAR